MFVHNGGNDHLVSLDAAAPGVPLADIALTGLTPNEVLAGIDIRPQNGLLYGLGINATANTGTLYCISFRTGLATAVGAPGASAMIDGGMQPINLPAPGVTGYGFDFNPVTDRIRVVAGNLNFRINPNTGLPVSVNPDPGINGATSSVDAAAHDSNQQNATSSTLYTLDGASTSLYVQNPQTNGTQTLGQVVTLNSAPVNFTQIGGFDIHVGFGTPATGSALALLTVAGVGGIYGVNLADAKATFRGTIAAAAAPADALAIQSVPIGNPAIALGSLGTTLVRFNTATPGSTTTQALGAPLAGETLVGIDFRPQNGALYGLGINAAGNSGTLYLIDPGSGALSSIGGGGGIGFVGSDGVTAIDLPVAAAGYGFDFNPAADRIRVTTSTGVNFRINPNTGGGVDGNTDTPGTNPDANINGSGAVGVPAVAYTNSYGQVLPGPATTLYTLNPAQNTLSIQNSPNAGTQTAPLLVTLGANTLDFTAAGGFDIPAYVSVATDNAAATGIGSVGIAALTVGGVGGIYSIDLVTGQATFLGVGSDSYTGLTLADVPPRPNGVFADGFE